MTDKPILLLDIDGVLNPYAMKHRSRERLGATVHPVDVPDTNGVTTTYNITLSPNNLTCLKSLMPHFEIHWCTSWNYSANKLFAPLANLPEFPVFDLTDAAKTPPVGLLYWKTPAVLDAFKTGGRFSGRNYAWVDDETKKYDRKAAEANAVNHSCKLEFVTPAYGLTDSNVDSLLKWRETLSYCDK